MDPPSTTLPSQPSQSPQRQRRRTKRVGESGEPVTKPKKVNSEIRKQQNRIASRNYREKRKRKLQYLQQLISDETEDKQRAEPSPERQEVYALSRTASSSIAGPSSSPYQMPSHSNISSMNARSKASHDAILAATTASFNSPHVTTSQAYPVYPANWNAQMYSPTPPPPPPPPANTAWNIPSIWASGFEQPVQNSPQPSVYHYSPEPAPIGFAQTQPLSHQPQEYLSNAYLYGYNSFSGSQHQVTHNPHVSLPSSSPGYQGYRPRPQ